MGPMKAVQYSGAIFVGMLMLAIASIPLRCAAPHLKKAYEYLSTDTPATEEKKVETPDASDTASATARKAIPEIKFVAPKDEWSQWYSTAAPTDHKDATCRWGIRAGDDAGQVYKFQLRGGTMDDKSRDDRVVYLSTNSRGTIFGIAECVRFMGVGKSLRMRIYWE